MIDRYFQGTAAPGLLHDIVLLMVLGGLLSCAPGGRRRPLPMMSGRMREILDAAVLDPLAASLLAAWARAVVCTTDGAFTYMLGPRGCAYVGQTAEQATGEPILIEWVRAHLLCIKQKTEETKLRYRGLLQQPAGQWWLVLAPVALNVVLQVERWLIRALAPSVNARRSEHRGAIGVLTSLLRRRRRRWPWPRARRQQPSERAPRHVDLPARLAARANGRPNKKAEEHGADAWCLGVLRCRWYFVVRLLCLGAAAGPVHIERPRAALLLVDQALAHGRWWWWPHSELRAARARAVAVAQAVEALMARSPRAAWLKQGVSARLRTLGLPGLRCLCVRWAVPYELMCARDLLGQLLRWWRRRSVAAARWLPSRVRFVKMAAVPLRSLVVASTERAINELRWDTPVPAACPQVTFTVYDGLSGNAPPTAAGNRARLAQLGGHLAGVGRARRSCKWRLQAAGGRMAAACVGETRGGTDDIKREVAGLGFEGRVDGRRQGSRTSLARAGACGRLAAVELDQGHGGVGASVWRHAWARLARLGDAPLRLRTGFFAAAWGVACSLLPADQGQVLRVPRWRGPCGRARAFAPEGRAQLLEKDVADLKVAMPAAVASLGGGAAGPVGAAAERLDCLGDVPRASGGAAGWTWLLLPLPRVRRRAR